MKRNTLLLIGILVATIIASNALAHNPSLKSEDKVELDNVLEEIKSIPEYSMFVKAFEKTKLKARMSNS